MMGVTTVAMGLDNGKNMSAERGEIRRLSPGEHPVL